MLLLAGWLIVAAAMLLLRSAASQGGFTLAGAGVEIMGLVLAARAHLAPRGETR